MPKRSSSTFESEKDGLRDESLGVQYCMACGEVVLILDSESAVAGLPKRRTDGAVVLERGVTTFRLKSKPIGTRVLKREGGCERQHRIGCWSCGIMLGYRSEDAEDAKLTYVLPDATGTQADLYLALYEVPQCIQPAGDAVRVALEVDAGQPRRAVLRVSDSDVGLSVVATPKEGLANAEVMEYMGKILGVPRPRMQLSRGWSASSKYLLVKGLEPGQVFKKLKAAVDADLGGQTSATAAAAAAAGGAGGDDGDGLGAADASSSAAAMGPLGGAPLGAGMGAVRRHWEQNADELEDLAEAPTGKQQAFIK